MKNLQFIFLRLSIYLVAGILSAFYFDFDRELILLFSGVVFCVFIFAFFRARVQIFPDALIGIASFLLIFCLGMLTTFFNIPENQPKHYINQNIELGDSAMVKGIITEELKPNDFSKRYLIETETLYFNKNLKAIKGKLLLNLKIDTLQSASLEPGMKVLLLWTPEEIRKPLNPFQFDYREYMQRLKVEQQINTDFSMLKITGKDRKSLFSYAWKTREHLIENLRKEDFRKDELAVFQALILGQRREISDELYKNYAAAGAIHILAISGLHVGILLLLLNFLLKPLEKLRFGKLLKPIILILLLWSFAFLTGFSASVVRAVCMFSFIAVGLQLKRKTSALNSLFLSLFFLLLINPHYIFQIGFQLSYLAVFSIITFQPVIYNLFKPASKPIDYFWKLTSVSLAAQIAVFPLSIFYFHQFPGLFLVSNLLVLPFLGIILAAGILVIGLASFGILPNFIADLFGYILKALNLFIEKIAGVESMILSGIDLSLFQNSSLYLILLSILFLTRKINFSRIAFLLISILIFQGFTFYSKMQIPASEVVIFHKTRESVIGIKKNDQLIILSESGLKLDFLKDYLRERQIKDSIRKDIPEVLTIAENLSLIVDTTRSYSLPDFNPEIVILRNSPKINFERLIYETSPQRIIADGSNYSSYINRWRKISQEREIPFYYTGEEGAYIIPHPELPFAVPTSPKER